MLLCKNYFTLGVLFIWINVSVSQELKGVLIDNVSLLPVSDLLVQELNSGTKLKSGSDGSFQFSRAQLLKDGQMDLLIESDLYHPFRLQVSVHDWNMNVQEFFLLPRNLPIIDNIEVSALETEEDNNSSDVYSLLSSSSDPVMRAAAFQFSSFRYRIRGLPVHLNQLGLNGFLLNNPISDYTPFYLLSGQNNITRYHDNYNGYKDNDFDFGAVGLGQWIQSEAHTTRKDLLINYALSNRNYTNRIGIHYASGVLGSSYSFVAGANRRWAREGFVEGSFYDSWGSYIGVSKSIGTAHHLSLLAVYAPLKRGKASPATQEVYNLSLDRHYNSYWGFQQGEKRNSRISNTSVPMALLNYSWKINDQLILKSGVMLSSGFNSDTRIDRYNAADPRPDYYQKLPSYIKVPSVAHDVSRAWYQNVEVRQINWDELYEANYNNFQTIHSINGSLLDSISGRRATYWLEQRHYDPSELEHFSHLFWNSGRNTFRVGYRIERSEESNYLKMNDLLGSDFMVDIEDFVTAEELRHPDIRYKNHIIFEGDRFSYDYSAFVTQLNAYLSYLYTARKWDFSLAGSVDKNSYYRAGRFQNAIFTNSLGTSETVSQNGYGLKSIISYKINGRNYIRWNGAYQKLPNRFDQLFINPQWRSDLLSYQEQTKIQSYDLGYFYRSPGLKIQLTAYWIQLKDQIINKNFYLDQQLETSSNVELADGGFINAFYTGLDQRHMGIESAVEWNAGNGFDLSVVYNLGDHIYTSRPEFLIFDKYSQAVSKHLIYIKNYYVPGSAQQALSAAIKYSFKQNGFVELSVNHLDQIYLEPNPLRRIEAAVEDVDRESELFKRIINQEKLPEAFYLNLYLYKGFRINKQHLGISFGVNNLLNVKNLISGGFEQFRFDYENKDPDKFPSKYYYFQGINFYLGFNFRL